MPQVLLFAAIGAGLLLLRRYLKKEQTRIQSDLAKAKDAMAKDAMDKDGMKKRDLDSAVLLEQDPATGVYRPKEPR